MGNSVCYTAFLIITTEELKHSLKLDGESL